MKVTFSGDEIRAILIDYAGRKFDWPEGAALQTLWSGTTRGGALVGVSITFAVAPDTIDATREAILPAPFAERPKETP